MGNLLNSLSACAGALRAFERVFEVTGNNVANASTPGYAAQVQNLSAMAFDPANGLAGGVAAGQIQSERNQYADQQVRQQTTLLGNAQQHVDSLTFVQDNFDVTGTSGISVALNNLFNSFSGWAQSPADAVARQTVLSSAADVAAAFQQTASGLTQAEQNAETQVGQTVDAVNALLGQLQTFNSQIMQGSSQDAGVDAQLHAGLEQLSQYVSFTTLNNADGTVTVLMNGQTPLLVEDRQYQISAQLIQPSSPDPVYAAGRPPMRIRAANGDDITGQTTGGQLGALLDVRNRVLPSYVGDAGQPGRVNQMAQQLANRVNQLLTGGQTAAGDHGIPLFTYDPDNGTGVAATLAVNPAITPAQLAAADPGPPAVANGVALALSGLAHPQDPADEIQGQSFTEFYAGMAAQVGHGLDSAKDQLSVQQSAVAQAKNLQNQMSGVSLDEQATIMMQFQRAYEANARMLTILDQLIQDTIAIIPG